MPFWNTWFYALKLHCLHSYFVMNGSHSPNRYMLFWNSCRYLQLNSKICFCCICFHSFVSNCEHIQMCDVSYNFAGKVMFAMSACEKWEMMKSGLLSQHFATLPSLRWMPLFESFESNFCAALQNQRNWDIGDTISSNKERQRGK